MGNKLKDSFDYVAPTSWNQEELRLHPNFVEEMMGFPIHWTDPETKH